MWTSRPAPWSAAGRAAAAAALRPRVAPREPVLVGLAGGVAVEREAAHPPGRAAVVGLRQPGMAHHQPPTVEHIMRDQVPAERLGALGKLLSRNGKLFQR